VIDDSGSACRGGCLSCVCGIGGRSLRSFGSRPNATHGSYGLLAAEELGEKGTADPAGRAKDDVGGVEAIGSRTLEPVACECSAAPSIPEE
jgi:hypothetical protein